METTCFIIIIPKQIPLLILSRGICFNTKTDTSTQYVDTFVEIDYSGNIPVLTKELLAGTQKFTVVMRNGKAVSEMFMDVTYEGNIVTIQSLN